MPTKSNPPAKEPNAPEVREWRPEHSPTDPREERWVGKCVWITRWHIATPVPSDPKTWYWAGYVKELQRQVHELELIAI